MFDITDETEHDHFAILPRQIFLLKKQHICDTFVNAPRVQVRAASNHSYKYYNLSKY